GMPSGSDLARAPRSEDGASSGHETLSLHDALPLLWARHDVRRKVGTQKAFHHPAVGTVTTTWEVLRTSDDGIRITVFQAEPGTPDHDALSLLALAEATR